MNTICFFSGDITRCGGTERVSIIIANNLAMIGKYRILFLSLMEQNDSPFFHMHPEIRRFTLKRGGKWRRPGAGYLPMVPALRHFLRKQDINIIIDIDIVLDALSIPASVGLPVKVISWEHFHYYYEQQCWYRKIIAVLSACFSDYIITLTRQDKANYEKKLYRRKKIDFIYNPVEVPLNPDISDRDDTGIRERALVTVGSLNKRKGTDLAAKLVPAILDRHRDWKWYFLGDGEYRAVLEETARRHHLEERFILTGNVPEVESYLKRASVYVMLSRLEGLPMCLLEAKACGLPCVSFDIQTGPSEIIEDGINGFLVPAFDLDLMEEKIALLMKDEVLRACFSQNAACGIEKFNLNRILQKWERVLKEVWK